MVLDQVHKQNNKYIKGVSGATNLVIHQDDTALIPGNYVGQNYLDF